MSADPRACTSVRIGAVMPVDPGKYVIEASAPGHETWTHTATVAPNGDSQTVTVPALQKLPETGAPAAGSGGAATSGSADVTRDSVGGKSSTLSWVLIGGGGAVLIAGGVFGYLAQQQASDAEEDPTLCPDKKCTPAGRDEIDAAETKALVSTIGVGVGVAAIATGVVLLVTGGSSSASASAPRVAPLVGARAGGLSLSGRF